jgi:hypothetical protein
MQSTSASIEMAHRSDLGFRLYDLPPELQDTIFEYAYPQCDNLKINFKKTWDLDEQYKRRRKGPNYVRRAFPSLKVETWMVSRRFFRAAAEAWMSAQAFHQQVLGSDDFTISEAFLLQDNKLFFEFGRHAVVKIENFRDDILPAVARCQNLRSLKLLVNEDLFEPLDRYVKIPWEEGITDDELSRVLSQSDVLALRKLESIPRLDHVDFDVTRSHFLNSSAKCETFTENLRRLLDLGRQSELRSSEVPRITDHERDRPPSLAQFTSGFHVLKFFCLTQSLLVLFLAPSLGWALVYAIVTTIACVLA